MTLNYRDHLSLASNVGRITINTIPSLTRGDDIRPLRRSTNQYNMSRQEALQSIQRPLRRYMSRREALQSIQFPLFLREVFTIQEQHVSYRRFSSRSTRGFYVSKFKVYPNKYLFFVQIKAKYFRLHQHEDRFRSHMNAHRSVCITIPPLRRIIPLSRIEFSPS